MPVTRGAQVARHLPVMGLRGADFIAERSKNISKPSTKQKGMCSMKVQVIYSASPAAPVRSPEAIYAALPAEEKELLDLKDGEPTLDGT